MNFERLKNPDDGRFIPAMALYQKSFPAHEQREMPSQIDALQCEDYHFILIEDQQAFVGLLLYWEAPGFVYVEHFCVDPNLRNQKYGQRALEWLASLGKTVVLEIDPPTDPLAMRRKGFYERCGFHANPYPHVHPPYHPGNKGHELVVMSYPAGLSRGEYESFYDCLQNRVMKI